MNIESNLYKQYERDGYHFPIKIFSSKELMPFYESFKKHQHYLGEEISLKQLSQLHLHTYWAHELVTHPKILQYITPILGPNILVHGSTLFYKKPKDNGYVSWHQDGYFMKLSSDKYITVWIAFENSTKENGCLQIIPKSHHKIYNHESLPNKNNILDTGLTITDPFKKELAVRIELKAGEASLHHVNSIHNSNPNTSDTPRIGFAIRYIAADVTQETYHHKVILAQGHYKEEHYQLLKEKPNKNIIESIESQKKAHNEYMRKRKAPQNN